jgi:DNA-binding transcriptional ArsR family regulator
MMAKGRQFTSQTVFDYLHENRGTRYTVSQLARNFDTSPQTMRNVVTALVGAKLARTGVQGTTRVYYILTDQEEQAENRMRMQIAFKPLSKDYIKAFYSAQECVFGR